MRVGSRLLMVLVVALVLAAQAPPVDETAAQTSGPTYRLIQVEHPPQGVVVRGNVEFYGRIIDPVRASVSAKWWMDDGDPSPVKLVEGTWRINWTAIGPHQSHVFRIQALNGLNQSAEENRVFRYEPLGQIHWTSKLFAWLSEWMLAFSAGVAVLIIGIIVTYLLKKHLEPHGEPGKSPSAEVEPFSVSWGNQTKPDRGTAVNLDVRIRCQPGPSTGLDYSELEVDGEMGVFIFLRDRTIRRITGERDLSVPSGQIVEFHLRFEHPDWLDIAGKRAITRVFLIGATPKTMEFTLPAINVRTPFPVLNRR